MQTKSGATDDEFAGFLNDKHDKIGDVPVLGGLADIKKFIDRNYHFIYTIYKIGGQPERIKLFNELEIPEDRLYTFISPRAYVAPNSTIEPGCVVMPQASVSSNTTVKTGSLLMVQAAVGHDVTV
jgi:NDP-sugar pyrophosphorylase family protein